MVGQSFFHGHAMVGDAFEIVSMLLILLGGCAMILTGNEDLRVRKTIEAIQSTFKQLLCEKPYEKITVKELCEKAQINKKTFYRYYETLDYLLVELESTYIQAYLERTKGLRIPRDIEAITREFCLFSASQDEVYERITCSPAFVHIQQSMTHDVMSSRNIDLEGLGDLPRGEAPLLLTFVTTTALELYRSWVFHGKTVSAERFADIACELICQGAHAYLRDKHLLTK